MPITLNGTTGVTYPDGVTQGSGTPNPGSSGAPLVSNGTTWTNNTAVAVASGGTGATTAAGARTNLGLAAIAASGSASDLTTGTVATARLASGTANSSTFLRGDQTWATVTSLPGSQGQVFTSNGTFTIPAGITALKVTVVGSGGTGSWFNGAGGGGGGTAIRFLTGLTSGNTLSVTVGARVTTQGGTGGSSTVSSGSQSISTITGGAGQGGAVGGGGASGGGASGGDINITGQRGQYNIVSIADQFRSSYVGGSSTYGFGGWNSDGVGFGAGGAAYDSNYFNGTSGIVIFEW